MAGNTVRVTFHGAAGTVTGSRYLIETDEHKVLIDCGLFQGRKELRLRNWEMPQFGPAELDAIILTHAHNDHTGYLPVVRRLGFHGPIYCTAPTQNLLSILLLDSARLQEEEARYANKHGATKHRPAKPLYTELEAKEVLKQVRTIAREQSNEILPGFSVKPSCAGHILGATSLSIDVAGKRLTFSGDVGRFGAPILPDPHPLDIGDLLVCESTYGDRDHPTEGVEKRLAEFIRAAASKNGPILVPAFAIGRTQDLLYHLAELERRAEIPTLPVYVDSPMAIDATALYNEYRSDFDDEATKLIAKGETPLLTENTTFVRTTDQSKRLNFLKGPRIIIAGSGMINGGRILHHVAHHIHDDRTTVLFVGYQADETRGRNILSGAKEVKIFGSYIPIRAEVKEISGLSAHGDRNELVRWLSSCTGSPRVVKITHGEPQPAAAFAARLTEEFRWKTEPARHLEQIEL